MDVNGERMGARLGGGGSSGGGSGDGSSGGGSGGGGVNRPSAATDPAARRRQGASAGQTPTAPNNFAGVLRRCLGVNCGAVFSGTPVNSTYCSDKCRASGTVVASAAPSAPAEYTAPRSLRQRLIDVVNRLHTCLRSASSGAHGLPCPRVNVLMFFSHTRPSPTLQGRDIEVKARALVLVITISSGVTTGPSFTEYHSAGFPGVNEVVPFLKLIAAVSTVDRSLSFTCGLKSLSILDPLPHTCPLAVFAMPSQRRAPSSEM